MSQQLWIGQPKAVEQALHLVQADIDEDGFYRLKVSPAGSLPFLGSDKQIQVGPGVKFFVQNEEHELLGLLRQIGAKPDRPVLEG